MENEFSAKLKRHLNNVYDYVTDEIVHYLEVGSEMGIAPNVLTKLRSVLSQQYSGNVTIMPNMDMLLKSGELLQNPTQEFLLHETVFGARATWPKLSMIRNNCGQEFALDKAIFFLKEKIIMSASIKNPLQFSEATIRVSDIPPHKKDSVSHLTGPFPHSEKTEILDDNIIEPETLETLLVHSGKRNIPKHDTRARSMSLKEPASLELTRPLLERVASSHTRRISIPSINYASSPSQTARRMVSPRKLKASSGRHNTRASPNVGRTRKGRSSTIIAFSTGVSEFDY